MEEDNVYTVGKLRYRLQRGHYIDDMMISGRYHEPWMFSWIVNNLNKESVSVDIGANFGCFSVLMASCAKKVICFEPMSIHHRITENMALNGFENYEVHNCVVGDVMADKVLANFESEWDCAATKPTDELSCVPVVRLDDVVDEKIDLIKIDTDGKELSVLKGMAETLGKYKPVICQELAVKTFNFDGHTWSQERIDNTCNWKEILDMYFDLGYSIVGQSIESNSRTADDLISICNRHGKISSIDILLK